jgi:DNA-binding beta-propeller fold protein YncE
VRNFPKAFYGMTLVLSLLVQSRVAADTVYVWSDDFNGTLRSFDTNGFVFVYSTGNSLNGWNGPTGLALDSVGNLYAGCPGQSIVYRFNPYGALEQSSYPNDSVSGLAFDFSGRLFETVPNYIALSATDYQSGFGYITGGRVRYTTSNLSYPVCLAFDDADNIYVANGGSDPSIEKFAHDFTDLGAFASGTNLATGLNNPWGIAFDTASNLYVANSGNNKILKIKPDGTKFVYATSTSGLNAPRGLAFDSMGNLYAANSGSGNILKFSTNGSVSVFASSLTSPTSIAIYPGLKVWSATPLKLNNPTLLSDGSFQFTFIASAGLNFSVLETTNLSQTLTNWTTVGPVAETSPGSYQFTNAQATNRRQCFYRIRSQ